MRIGSLKKGDAAEFSEVRAANFQAKYDESQVFVTIAL
jgi:hypothetical protein